VSSLSHNNVADSSSDSWWDWGRIAQTFPPNSHEPDVRTLPRVIEDLQGHFKQPTPSEWMPTADETILPPIRSSLDAAQDLHDPHAGDVSSGRGTSRNYRGERQSLRARKSKQRMLQGRWRLVPTVPPPSRNLSFPHEHPQTQFDALLNQTSNFYSSTFETMWQPMLQKDNIVFELQAHPQLFDESMYTVSGLLDVGQGAEACKIIERMFQLQSHVILGHHPQAYYLFMILSFQNSKSTLGQVHRALRKELIPISDAALGPAHPLSKILRLDVPDEIRRPLQAAIMRKILDLFYDAFGAQSTQTVLAHLSFGRMLRNIGYYREAIDAFAALQASMEIYQPFNSLVCVYGLLETVNTYLASGDSSVLPEMHLHDGFRRLRVMFQNLEKIEDPEEREYVEVAYVNGHLMALRTLGRLQHMRRNYGAAIQAYSEALDVGTAFFGPEALPVRLAAGTLENVKMDELRHSMAGLALPSVDGRPPPPPSDHEMNVTETAWGLIKSSNRRYLGTHHEEIPPDPGLVYGLSLLGMPEMLK
jgi:tetratricopeptide (TPR) repeat protein